MEECLITKLKGTATGNIPAFGSYTVELYNVEVGNVYSARASTIDSNTLTLSNNAYFCVGKSNTTPINGTADNSRSLVISENARRYTQIYVYIAGSGKVTITIGDKYKFEGFGIGGNSVDIYYDVPIEDLMYMSNWDCFSRGTTKNLSEYPVAKIRSAYRLFEGDISNSEIVFGSMNVVLNNLTGSLHVNDTNEVGTIVLSGTFSFDIGGLTKYPVTDSKFVSSGITGEIDDKNNVSKNIQIGGEDRISGVTIASSLTSFPATDTFRLYSSGVTVDMLKKLVDLLYSQSEVTQTVFILVSTASGFTEAAIRADADLMAKIASLKQSIATFTINDFDL